MIRSAADSERQKPSKPPPPIPTNHNNNGTLSAQMLNENKESLGYLHCENNNVPPPPPPPFNTTTTTSLPGFTSACAKTELSVSNRSSDGLASSNASGTSSVISSPSSEVRAIKSRGLGYHQKALEKIRISLQPFAANNPDHWAGGSTNSEPSSGTPSECGASICGLSTKNTYQQLLNMGYTEEYALKALRLMPPNPDETSSKCSDSSTSSSHKMGSHSKMEPPNGFTRPGKKVLNIRKSFDPPCWERMPLGESSSANSKLDGPCIIGLQPQHLLPDLPRLINGNHHELVKSASINSNLEPPPPIPPPRGVISPPPLTPPPRNNPPPPPTSKGQPPPPPPPSSSHHPSTSTPSHVSAQQFDLIFKRMSPKPQQNSSSTTQSHPLTYAGSSSSTPQRGTSPVGNHCAPVLSNSDQQLVQRLQQLSVFSSLASGQGRAEAPPPYPNSSSHSPASLSSFYSSSHASSSSGQHSPGDYAPAMHRSTPPPAYSPPPSSIANPVVTNILTRPAHLQAWSSRQAKSQSPVIMQSVKSTQVQKPILQTAIAPPTPQLCTPVTVPSTSQHTTSAPLAQPTTSNPSNGVTLPQRPAPDPPPYQQNKNPPLYPRGQHVQPPEPPPYPHPAALSNSSPPPLPPYLLQETVPPPPPYLAHKAPPPIPESRTSSRPPMSIPTTDPPSYASSIAALAAANRGTAALSNKISTSPSPSSNSKGTATTSGACNLVNTVESICTSQVTALPGNYDPMYNGQSHPPLQRKHSINLETGSIPSRSGSPVSFLSTTSSPSTQSDCTQDSGRGSSIPPSNSKMALHSPIPVRKVLSKEKEEERRESKVKNYSSAAFKFYMEQHVENLLKSHKERERRREALEREMNKCGLSKETQMQMKKLLNQKESNYIRLKRAKMNKSMFDKIRTIGIGAFGEVALVRKVDSNNLFAMKTLRKDDVLKRNQVAHVKAERDILAEADNEWVVKLYYSFQDKDNLYFVMDYIPGGDLMSLLIKLGIFPEDLARFYIAELVLAVESVHKMGFIHRDIKPDNILIDRDGHIKLTDFGLCTGFRWTHNSKYYQRNGDHSRQDSMVPDENWSLDCHCKENCKNNDAHLKPLERRRRREHQRCLAHSLVGTPNYIAPEVLARTGYTKLCDWWSVGVILYEMLVGQPPFLANSPHETQQKVINWETCFHIPKAANLSPESNDLLLKLCCGADRRLGKNGTDEIKAHPFFRTINFDAGIRRQAAPYIPEIRYPTDTSNFDSIEDVPPGPMDSEEHPYDESSLAKKQPEHAFFEFTFRRFFDDGNEGIPLRITLDETDNQDSPVYV